MIRFCKKNWLNNGPVSLKKELPSGWREDLSLIYNGASIQLLTLGREHLLKSKLFAYVDRGVDLRDLLQMLPSKKEIENSYDWVVDRDNHPDWPTHTRRKFEVLIELLEKKKKGS